ncbi:MAG: hypothetical protein OXU40_08430 [Nitrospira sp.]|nr:hypothetical protein [Nitrospira sp.]
MASKYDDLFDFYIKLYDDEIARFRSLDAKIGRYLSAYSILVALIGFVGVSLRFLLRDPGSNVLVSVNYVFLACVFVAYFIGFYHMIRALKVQDLARFAYDQSMIEFFVNHKRNEIKYALVRNAKEAIEYNALVGDEKSAKMAKAIIWSFSPYTMMLLAASILLAVYNSCCSSIL